MVTATDRVPVAQGTVFVRAEDFRKRMIEAHRDAFATKQRPLFGRHRLADMFRAEPRYVIGDTQRAAFDALFKAGASDDKIRNIAALYTDYVEAFIAERDGLVPCAREAFREVVKETGEATLAQLVAEQDPSPANRLRAERETREAKHAHRRYLNALWHDALESAASAVRRCVAHVGDSRWV